MIDRVGRRKPLLWGTVGITLALICESIINSQIDDKNPQHGLSIGGVFFLFCVTVIFSCEYSATGLLQVVCWIKANVCESLLGSYLLGLHVRSHAHANPCSWKCLRNRYWKLARRYFLGTGLPSGFGSFDMEVLLLVCW
jgi:hypothetical protein